jgi:hypothetical protein
MACQEGMCSESSEPLAGRLGAPAQRRHRRHAVKSRCAREWGGRLKLTILDYIAAAVHSPSPLPATVHSRLHSYMPRRIEGEAQARLSPVLRRVAHDGGEVIELRLPPQDCPRALGGGHDLRRITGAAPPELDGKIDPRDPLYRFLLKFPQ